MTKLIWKIAGIAAVSAGLAACGDSSSPAPGAPVVTPPAAPKLEDGFGANFGIAYRAAPNTDAKDPVAGDIIPLDLTKDPVTI